MSTYSNLKQNKEPRGIHNSAAMFDTGSVSGLAPESTHTLDAAASSSALLPENKMQALYSLIKATNMLIELAEREKSALMSNDMSLLQILQEEKKFLSARYSKLSQEFRARLSEFKDTQYNSLIDQLEVLQKALHEKSTLNNSYVESLRSKNCNYSQNSLLAAQEYAQHSAPSSTRYSKGVSS